MSAKSVSLNLYVSILSAVTVFLAVNLHRASRENERLEAVIAHLKAPYKLQVGEMIPSFETRMLPSSTAHFDFSDDMKPSILYTIRAGCMWCTRNALNFNSLVAQVGDRYRIIVASRPADDISALEAYGSSYYPDTPVALDLPRVLVDKLAVTPYTVVLSGAGEVVKSWPGAYQGHLLDEVEGFFGVELPGLKENDVAAFQGNSRIKFGSRSGEYVANSQRDRIKTLP